MNEHAPQTNSLPPRHTRVDGNKRPRNRGRSRGRTRRTLVRRVNAIAVKRQAVWAQSSAQANEIERLSRELDQAFEELRASSTGLGAPYGRTDDRAVRAAAEAGAGFGGRKVAAESARLLQRRTPGRDTGRS